MGGIEMVNNHIFGNYIGIDAAGTNGIGTQSTGIGVFNGTEGTIIGGTTAGMGNVISGNNGTGVYISDPGTSDNVVLGNLIGTDKTGTNLIPNVNFGVFVYNYASSNVIGGTTAGARNVISGTTGYGYGIAVAEANNNVVQGNYIGTDLTGTNALPNGFAGVAVESGSVGNLVGGTAAGAGNIIAFNTCDVVLYQTNTTNNAIRGNSIHDDYYGGIVLDQFPGNHIGYESGPDDWQNYPVINSAFGFGNSTIVQGSLNSLTNQTCFIDFYYNNVQVPVAMVKVRFISAPSP
jgi:hypothetical protein